MSNQSTKPNYEYQNRIDKYSKKVTELDKKINLISICRGLVFLGTASLLGFLYFKNIREYIFLIAILGVAIFICFVAKHNKLKDERLHNEILKNINVTSQKRITGEWKEFKDIGEEYIDEEHQYSKDLDIFGKGSLFQMINSSNTINGRKSLAGILTRGVGELSKLNLRQSAIAELASKIDWRQEFQAEGMKKKAENIKETEYLDLQGLYEWSNKKNTYFNRLHIKLLSKILPFATISMLVFAIAKFIPYYPFGILLSLQILMLLFIAKDTIKDFNVVDKYRNIIEVYERMVKLIEDEDFESEYVKDLREELRGNNNRSAYKQIKTLSSITSMIAMRYSELYLVFNFLLLWDYQCGIALENWKKKTGMNLEKWFNIIGELEAFSSLAILNFENPEWCIPKIDEKRELYIADSIGHPLLNKERVANNFKLDTRGGVILITGSNMSGKSTLLRTAGINLVLAYAGSAVCAEKLICPPLDLYTSMRVDDNLEKNISSFYAELLRIKSILEAVRSGKKVFFLLDEIFRGTNSRDRHTGAKILIKNLIKEGAAGFVSTHDLELGDLEEDADLKINNFHFKEYYRDGQIYFDYKLYRGVSTTRNAMYLMKLAGIDFDNI